MILISNYGRFLRIATSGTYINVYDKFVFNLIYVPVIQMIRCSRLFENRCLEALYYYNIHVNLHRVEKKLKRSVSYRKSIAYHFFSLIHSAE